MEQGTIIQKYWAGWKDRHPSIVSWLGLIGSLIEFIFGGHFIVKLGHKVIMFAGRTAETAMLFAALWVSGMYIAPAFMTRVSFGQASLFSELSILSFTLLPEVILFSAIVVTYKHWYKAIAQKVKSSYVWGVLYILPTGAFFVMAVYTFCSFISSGEQAIFTATGQIKHADGWSLVVRALSGWGYCLIGLVYNEISKIHPSIATPASVEPDMNYEELARQLTPVILEQLRQIGMPQQSEDATHRGDNERPETVTNDMANLPNDMATNDIADVTEIDKLALALRFLKEHPALAERDDADSQLASFLGIHNEHAAHYWRLKAEEVLSVTQQHQENVVTRQTDELAVTNESDKIEEVTSDNVAESDKPTRQHRDKKQPVNMARQKKSDTTKLAEYMAKHPGATRQQIADALGVSVRTLQRKLGDGQHLKVVR